jgi:hypothetical protein
MNKALGVIPSPEPAHRAGEAALHHEWALRTENANAAVGAGAPDMSEVAPAGQLVASEYALLSPALVAHRFSPLITIPLQNLGAAGHTIWAEGVWRRILHRTDFTARSLDVSMLKWIAAITASNQFTLPGTGCSPSRSLILAPTAAVLGVQSTVAAVGSALGLRVHAIAGGPHVACEKMAAQQASVLVGSPCSTALVLPVVNSELRAVNVLHADVLLRPAERSTLSEEGQQFEREETLKILKALPKDCQLVLLSTGAIPSFPDVSRLLREPYHAVDPNEPPKGVIVDRETTSSSGTSAATSPLSPFSGVCGTPKKSSQNGSPPSVTFAAPRPVPSLQAGAPELAHSAQSPLTLADRR